VSRLDFDGQNVTTWSPGGDLEGVTIADPQSDLIYLGVEHPDSVVEFDLGSGSLTGSSWDLTPWMTGPNSRGLEALTYVNGLFYAGLQNDGGIYVFDLQPAGVVSFIEVIPNAFGRDDLSGLHYETTTETLYAVHDSFDVIVEMDSDGSFVREFDLPLDNQEGIAIEPNCDAAVARAYVGIDLQEVQRYDAYPVTCVAVAIPALAHGQLAALLLLLLGAGRIRREVFARCVRIPAAVIRTRRDERPGSKEQQRQMPRCSE
jgi:hypothetical protein